MNPSHDLRPNQQELQHQVQKQVRRMKQAERDRPSLLRHTLYLGTLGVMFILPIVIGAYAGLWLDKQSPHYEWHWTVCLIVLGIFIGAVNVYLFVREPTS